MEKEESQQKTPEDVLKTEIKTATLQEKLLEDELDKKEFTTEQPVKQEEPTKTEQSSLSSEQNFVSLENKNSQTDTNINKEELSIEDLHNDLEGKLQEQGFIFDKRKFIFNDNNLTFGERLADKVASFGGSWKFIMLFGLFIATWICINIFWFLNQGYDPYPFILLNLILSCLASLQAPIIMMSQNRQADIDRKQEEINIEKEILDFKQDRLDLILDQKQWDLLREMDSRIKNIEAKLNESKKVSIKKSIVKKATPKKVVKKQQKSKKRR